MSGHSRWANTKHRKAAQDVKRGKRFTKIIRALVTTARLGGGDISSNPRLRAAVETALFHNMTRDTIQRAIARGVGGDDDLPMETFRYEGYGPGGTAVIVECLSENRNRTTAQVRNAFTKTGGHLATNGSVSYLFTKQGVISVQPGYNEDTVMDAALEAGADDVVTNDNGAIDVYTTPDCLGHVKDALADAGITASAEVAFIPSTITKLDDQKSVKLLRLIEMLEDSDDVQEIYHNGEMTTNTQAGVTL